MGSTGKSKSGGAVWWLRVVVCTSVALSQLGCSSANESDETAAPTSRVTSDVLVCGTHAQVSATGETEQVPSWFNVAGINAKLKQYPRLAEAYGKSVVSSCDDAKDYVVAYQDFSAKNPGFDLDQAFIERRPPPLPDSTPPEVSEVKISGGNLKAFAPVVELETVQGTRTKICTGSFIAKNWILTAAHCLNIGTGPTPKADNAYYRYLIKWSDNAGLVRRSMSVPWVLQFVSPSYTGDYGDKLPTVGIGTDFAVLYVGKQYDGFLPPGGPDQTDFLRLSLAGFATSSAEAWGWGLPINGLAYMSISNHVPIGQSPDDPSVIRGKIPTAPPYLCHGDSGGPLVDKYFLPAASGGQVPAIVGTFVGGSVVSDTAQCFTKTGPEERVYWARVDQQFRFIRAAQRSYYGPAWDCKIATEVGSTTTKVAQCSPTACKVDADCAAEPNTHCETLAEDQVYGNLCNGPSADCIYGKCLPNYDSDL
jgi:hypothetical protein